MIRFFAKYDDLIVQLPVNPESLSFKSKSNNKTVDIVNGGQVTNIGFEGLKDFKISSFFPAKIGKYLRILETDRFRSGSHGGHWGTA